MNKALFLSLSLFIAGNSLMVSQAQADAWDIVKNATYVTYKSATATSKCLLGTGTGIIAVASAAVVVNESLKVVKNLMHGYLRAQASEDGFIPYWIATKAYPYEPVSLQCILIAAGFYLISSELTAKAFTSAGNDIKEIDDCCKLA